MGIMWHDKNDNKVASSPRSLAGGLPVSSISPFPAEDDFKLDFSLDENPGVVNDGDIQFEFELNKPVVKTDTTAIETVGARAPRYQNTSYSQSDISARDQFRIKMLTKEPDINDSKASVSKFARRIKSYLMEKDIYNKLSIATSSKATGWTDTRFYGQISSASFYYFITKLDIKPGKDGRYSTDCVYPCIDDLTDRQLNLFTFFDIIYHDKNISFIDDLGLLVDTYCAEYRTLNYPIIIDEEYVDRIKKISRHLTEADISLIVDAVASGLRVCPICNDVDDDYDVDDECDEDEDDDYEESEIRAVDDGDIDDDSCLSAELMTDETVNFSVLVIKSANALYQPIYVVWDDIESQYGDTKADWTWLRHFMPVLKFRTSDPSYYIDLNEEYASIKFTILNLEDDIAVIGLYNMNIASFADETGEDEDIIFINKIATVLKDLEDDSIFSHLNRTLQMPIYESEDTIRGLIGGDYTDSSDADDEDEELEESSDEELGESCEEDEDDHEEEEEPDISSEELNETGESDVHDIKHEPEDVDADDVIPGIEIEVVNPDDMDAATILTPIRSTR